MIIFFLFIIHCFASISSWYIPSKTELFSPQYLKWEYYDYIHFNDPIVYSNGTAQCNSSDVFLQNLIYHAHKKNVKVLWGCGLHNFNIYNDQMIENYLSSIGKAVKDCNIDGISIDYEWQNTNWGKLGIITPEQSTKFTEFLSNIKIATGGIVSADVSVWGYKSGYYPLEFFPWVNVSMLNAGKIDFINTMSYHWDKDGNIDVWKKDAFILHDIWGIDKNRVHIGIPYFSKKYTNGILSEPTWSSLSSLCPNININTNVCNNTTFVGKKMNYEIGKWLKEEGWLGAFPWALTYDSIQYNNSLIKWLKLGLEKN